MTVAAGRGLSISTNFTGGRSWNSVSHFTRSDGLLACSQCFAATGVRLRGDEDAAALRRAMLRARPKWSAALGDEPDDDAAADPAVRTLEVWTAFFSAWCDDDLDPWLARLGDAVPEDVDMGYHLCYGSPADEHLVMPRDMAVMVGMANDLRDVIGRRLDFLHMPVPKDRVDADYFKPLADLRRAAAATVYLGLIHHDDHAGDVARIRAARAYLPAFGVASECGWGRTDPRRVPGLLESHLQGATA